MSARWRHPRKLSGDCRSLLVEAFASEFLLTSIRGGLFGAVCALFGLAISRQLGVYCAYESMVLYCSDILLFKKCMLIIPFSQVFIYRSPCAKVKILLGRLRNYRLFITPGIYESMSLFLYERGSTCLL